jgi:hypothetical protein
MMSKLSMILEGFTKNWKSVSYRLIQKEREAVAWFFFERAPSIFSLTSRPGDIISARHFA